jgi:hypothetical protein
VFLGCFFFCFVFFFEISGTFPAIAIAEKTDFLTHTQKAGNHERRLPFKGLGETRALFAEAGARLLIDESAECLGLEIFGSPWTPTRSRKHRRMVSILGAVPSFATTSVAWVGSCLGSNVAFTLPRNSRPLRAKWDAGP